MTNQYINKIPLSDTASMKEFFLIPGESAPIAEEKEVASVKIDPLVERYFAERFVEFGGKKLPAIYEGTYQLSNLTMETLDVPFEPGARFQKAINARRRVAFENLLKNGGHDGKNISIRDWHILENQVKFVGQAMYYSQFMATDNAQDEPLKLYDNSFPEGATLRDYVVVNGKEMRKRTDTLSNLLGAAFIVRAKGQDEQDYFLLGRIQRKKTISIIGGTPMWEEAYDPEQGIHFADYMRKLGAQEHEEELCLRHDEIEIGSNVQLVRTLLRVFDPFYSVDVDPTVTVEDIATRCLRNDEALKEHDRLYAVPRSEEALKGLMNNQRGYNINPGTIAGLLLDLQK